MTDDRTEHDSLGDVRVPSGVLWGPQTQRATENFPISGSEVDPALIRALALVKAAAARVNGELGALDADRSAAVERAALQVAAGEHTDQFPVDVFQTGSGTSTNMNLNEVIAKLASTPDLPIHPNDHVNVGQSSNDTFPTAIHVAAARAVREELIPGLHTLQAALAAKSAEFADLVKAGRTHLMDATPVTLGQEFSGYAATVGLALERLDGVLPRVCELPLGGTAVGTGLTASPAFAAQVIGLLTEVTGVPFTETRNHFEGQGTRDSLVELSGVLRTIAVGLTKIANDLRWMASGPLTGLAEIRLPALQPGSSIMPGKVNPVLPEAALMVCAQVVGNDATIAWAGASGSFELNTMLPVLGQNLLESIRLLARVTPLLATRCIDGITADAARLRRFAEASPAIATALARRLGYDRTAEVVAHAQQASLTIKEAVIALGFVADGTLAESELDALLDVDAMTRRAPDGSAG